MSSAVSQKLSRARHAAPAFPRVRWPGRRTWLIVIASTVGSLAFAAGLLQTQLFSVDRIDVVGATQISREDVLSIAKLKTGGSIATVDASAAERQLETHPWVLRADVQTQWPHVVRVVITEQRAVAIAQTDDKRWAQLGPDGTVLTVGPAPTKDLPVALGVVAPGQPGAVVPQSASPLMSVATQMPASLQPLVLQMKEEGGVLKLGLDAGTVVLLGDASGLPEKLMSAASVFAHTEPKDIATLDVTSPRFPVATPKEEVSTSGSQMTIPTKAESLSATSGSTEGGATKKSSTTTTTKKTTSSTTTPRRTVTTLLGDQ